MNGRVIFSRLKVRRKGMMMALNKGGGGGRCVGFGLNKTLSADDCLKVIC
jgi:hypothetical protein